MNMTMSSEPISRVERVEVITSVQRRRRWTTAEKVRLIEEAMQPGSSVSLVARRAGVSPSLLFGWKRRMLEGSAIAVQADDDVVAAGVCAIWSACWAASHPHSGLRFLSPREFGAKGASA